MKPQTAITNGIIKAKLYLPDAQNGYYRATRFDWSGIISSLECNGHTYFGKWFEHYNPTTHDAIMGPVDSFAPLNYEETPVGNSFVKIGVGLLQKTAAEGFGEFTTYPILDPGQWKIKAKADQIQFSHVVADSHYTHEYTKTVQLMEGKAEMHICYALINKGNRTIKTEVYNHNFFVIDNQLTGMGFELIFTKNVAFRGKILNDIPQIQGNRIRFRKDLSKGETIYCSSLEGINGNAKDYDIQVRNHNTGAGVRITGDQPISKMVLWGASTTVCPEPYIDIRVEPGQEFRWSYCYDFL